MATIIAKAVTCRNGNSLTIRTATTADAARLDELVKRLISDGEGQLRLLEEYSTPDSYEEQEERIRKHQDHHNWLFLLAETDGHVVGCLDFSCGSISRLAHRGVFSMGVRPGWRSMGIGRRLLETLIKRATANPSLEKVCLAVVATNSKAIALDKSMGFHEEGRRIREVKLDNGRYVDDILMHRFV